MRKPIQAFIFFFISMIFSFNTSVASSDGIIFSDDFSHDLSKWTALRDDGRYWKIADQKLESYIPFSSTVTELIPKVEFMRPLENYLFELDYTPLEGGDRTIAFGVQDKNNWYEIHFAPQMTHIVRLKDGKVAWSETYQYILQNGNTYRMSLLFVEGKITLLINGSQRFQTLDPTYTSQPSIIAVKAATGGIFPTRVILDNILVREVTSKPDSDGTQLGVAVLKQGNPEWANQEYDSSSIWAQTLEAGITIKDWGCNLVSLVMLLHFHGITKFPDGSDISPISLNNWLLANSGFYGNPPSGNINRHSISKLTAEVSNIYHTPKLEFKYVGEDLLQTAITEIEKGNPVILELEGHFVIADGFTEDKSDLYIKDPGYSVEKLSQHPLALKSVRLFTPSQTDLSYISVISEPDITVNVANAVQYQEQTRLLSEDERILSQPTYITELEKPVDGSYEIKVTNSSTLKKSVIIETYALDGKQKNFTLTVSPGEQVFTLQFSKEGRNFIKKKKDGQFSYKDLRKTIVSLSDINQIKQTYVEKILLGLIKHAETVSVSDQKKILNVVKTIISFSPNSHITKAAQALLLDQVKMLMVALKQ